VLSVWVLLNTLYIGLNLSQILDPSFMQELISISPQSRKMPPNDSFFNLETLRVSLTGIWMTFNMLDGEKKEIFIQWRWKGIECNNITL
jgi:hypothetical protein